MVRNLVASLFAALLITTMSAAVVGAAPVNNPHAEFYTVQCSNGETYDIVVGAGNVAHILDTNQHFIPHHFTWELFVNGDLVDSESDGVGKGQKRGLQDRLVTCTFEFEFALEDLTPEDIEYFESVGIDLDEVTSIVGRGSVQGMITPGGPKK